MPNPLSHPTPDVWTLESRDTAWTRAPAAPPAPLHPLARHAAALLLVAIATGLAFVFAERVGAPNLTLIFVLPVIASATWFGWGPSLVATAAGVLSFDFFFTAPKYSLEIDSPADIWAAALLLAVAVVVSAVAAESRRREQAARLAAEQALALQAMAHTVIEGGSQQQIAVAAATALNRIFNAPAVIFMPRAGEFQVVASVGGARITAGEAEAAGGARDAGVPARADTYPYVGSTFDFWPVTGRGGTACDCVIGVGFLASGRARPEAPERFIEIVGAYLAVVKTR